MKIAFFCSSLEPGRDGVGDYTRRLAGELIRQGCCSTAIALNDPYISKTVMESQEIDGAAVSVLRLPSIIPWDERMTQCSYWPKIFNCDWMSLQFVPFGFQAKGLCFGLGKRLAAVNAKASWHIMFHELWLGLGAKSSLKHRAWGALQRLIVMDLMQSLRPRIVHTQAESHRIALKRENIKASILPLFSNIPQIGGDGWNGLLEPSIASATGKRRDRTDLYLAGVLGMVAPEWSAEQTVNALLPLVQRFRKQLVLIFFGRSNLTQAACNKLKVMLQNRADIVLVGEQKSVEMSRILQALDLGIATTPRQMLQKSGAVAAMLEHGLPVLVTRDDWHLRGSDFPRAQTSSRLLSPQQFALLSTLPGRHPPPEADATVKQVAGEMLSTFESQSPQPEAILKP